jgi:hypothetical protein
MGTVKVEIRQVELSEVKPNKNNPRTITGKDMDRLVKSLTDFPEMLQLREIVVDETMTVLGGNMRLLALRKIGAKEATAKIVKGLTPEQKREFVIKDNGENWGRWDFDALANGWGDLPLVEWGVKMVEYTDDPNEEWEGMPECRQDDLSAWKSITVNFKGKDDLNDFSRIIGQHLTEKTRSVWHPRAEILKMDEVYKSES